MAREMSGVADVRGADKKTKKLLAKLDKQQLLDVATRPGDINRRLLATAMLGDNFAWCRLAADQDLDNDVRLAAIECVDAPLYQDVLFAIVMSDSGTDVRLSALKRLTTPQYLLHVIKNIQTDGAVIEQAAVGQLPFHEMICDVGLHADNPAVRAAAPAFIREEAVLQRMAEQDKDYRVRGAALRYVYNEEAHAALAQKLQEDLTIKDYEIRQLCEDIVASSQLRCQACDRLWEWLDTRILVADSYAPIIQALCESMHFEVERIFDRALVSAEGIDLNGNRAAAHMLSHFYENDKTDRQSLEHIKELDGMIVAYIELDTRHGPMLQRMLFDPGAKNGVRNGV